MPAQTLTTRELIDKLISFDTTSRNSNLELIEFVEEYLAGHGIASTRVANDDNTKTNLFATIGPADRTGGIVLSGHTDVVPIDGQDWTTAPFTVAERDGYLFGRGTSDMKSFLACALAAVPRFIAAEPKVPVYLALSYDEEVGCLGVRPMIDTLIRALPRPQVVIVGEPSNMKVVNAHKGIRSYTTKVTGLEFHSSQTHQGVSAIQYAMELISELMRLADEMRTRENPSSRFTPPYTTINIGHIKGGTAVNIIPRTCVFGWEYRSLPDADEAEVLTRFNDYAMTEVLPRMRAVFADASIETVVRAESPGLTARDGDAGETLVMKLAQCNETEAVSYNTEAGLFQLADIPTVICGPGSIDQAHKPNEFIALSQVAECDRFMARLAEHVSGA
ncbi:MAG: acetylornithine deacetylase [Parvibaculum sp.]|nr:acetylornithine deacetylase [Parvibaculum sp.]